MEKDKLVLLTSLIEKVAKTHGVEDAFYVGGYPRTVVMRAPTSDIHDLDLATASMGKATTLAGLIAGEVKGAEYELLHRTMTVRLEVMGEELDFQGPMVKEEIMPYLRKAGIKATPLAMNIYGRDFTLNSLAIPVTSPRVIIDLTERGVDDINNEVIASVLPPRIALPDNPLMITRAVRFSAKYNFRIEDNLWAAMKEFAPILKEKMSVERLAIEAFTLSKYKVKDDLEKLGIGYMASPQMVMAGKEIAEEE